MKRSVLPLLISAGLLLGAGLGAIIAKADIVCGGGPCYGNDNPNVFAGSDVHDAVYAYAGNDLGALNAGGDYFEGHNGLDGYLEGGYVITVEGRNDNDTMKGLNDSDALSGQYGNDDLWGGPSYDYLYGKEGNDYISGGGPPNYCNGGPGSNTIVNC